MFQVVKMLKDKRLSSMEDTIKSTKDGESSTLTHQRKTEPQELTKTLDLKLTNHSTSDQECQCTELLKL
jgi:hypothetical protein